MTAYGYDAEAQSGWCSFGKSFNLSALVEGHARHGLPGMYRIDCVGCQSVAAGDGGKYPANPSFANGVICDLHAPGCGDVTNRTECPEVYHLCEKARGDATDWKEQTHFLLGLARPHLISGVLRGVFLGDELTASGRGNHAAVKEAFDFDDLEMWIDLVRGFLDALAPARKAAGVNDELILYCEFYGCMITCNHERRPTHLFPSGRLHLLCSCSGV